MRFYVSEGLEGEWGWYAMNPARDGVVVAISPQSYTTEKGARSAIARARKAFAGAKMATVEVVDLDAD